MNIFYTANAGRAARDRGADTRTGSKSKSAVGRRLSRLIASAAGVVFVATIALVAESKPAEAFVVCTGTPHDAGNSFPDNWYFDPDTRSCGSSNSGFGGSRAPGASEAFTETNGPLGGFRIATDDDDLSIAEAYPGVDANGNPTPGVGIDGNMRFERAFTTCSSKLLRVDDPDSTDGIGQYRDGWDNTAYRVCPRRGVDGDGGARFVAANGERFVIQLTFTGAGNGITYNVIFDMTARDVNPARRDGTEAGHWVHRVVVWGGAFGASPSAEAIRNFMARRASVIINEDPDLVERLRGGAGRVTKANLLGLRASGTLDNFDMSFRTSLRSIARASQKQAKPSVAALRGQTLATESVSLASSQGPESTSPAASIRGTGPEAAVPPPDPETDLGFDVWTKGKYVNVNHEHYRSHLALFYLGADYRFNRDLVVGVLGQVDWTNENTESIHDHAGTKATGIGWLAGPYAVARLHDNLILDGRVAIGTSHNKIKPFRTYIDGFTTMRWLARGQLTGDFSLDMFDTEFTINPFVRATYFEESSRAYTSSTGERVGRQTIRIGRLNVGPKISARFKNEGGDVFAPYATLSGFWDFEEPSLTGPNGHAAGSDDIRGRIEAGLNFTAAEDYSLSGQVFYEGLGLTNYVSYGAGLKLTFRFGGSRATPSSFGAAPQSMAPGSLADDEDAT